MATLIKKARWFWLNPNHISFNVYTSYIKRWKRDKVPTFRSKITVLGVLDTEAKPPFFYWRCSHGNYILVNWYDPVYTCSCNHVVIVDELVQEGIEGLHYNGGAYFEYERHWIDTATYDIILTTHWSSADFYMCPHCGHYTVMSCNCTSDEMIHAIYEKLWLAYRSYTWPDVFHDKTPFKIVGHYKISNLD